MRAAPAVIAVLVLAGLAAPVAAHPFLESSDPAPGETLPEGATVVVLEFGESVDPATLSVTVTGEDGGDLVESVEPLADGRTVRVITAPLSAGSYELEWRVTSVDGHPAEGTLALAVGAGSTAGDAAAEGTTGTWDDIPGGTVALAAETLAGWAFLAGALVTVGLPFVGLVVEPAVPRTWRAAVVGAAGLAVVGGLGVLVTLAYRHGDLVTAVATTGGAVRAVGVVLLAGALGGAALAWRRDRAAATHVGSHTGMASGTAAPLAAASGLALAGLAADALASHGLAGAGAMGIGSAWVMLVGLVHTSAAAVWLGGLVGLSLTARRSREAALAAARRFSPWALGAVVALGLTGVAYADAHLLRWEDLFTTRYGGLILAKALLIVVPLAFAAYHRYRTLPNGQESRLRVSVSLEALALAGMLLLAAHLAASPRPAHDVTGGDLDRGRWHTADSGQYRLTLVTPDPPHPDGGRSPRLRVASEPLPGISLPRPQVVVDPPGRAEASPVDLIRDGDAWVLPARALSRPGEWTVRASLDGPHGPASASWTVTLEPEVTDG